MLHRSSKWVGAFVLIGVTLAAAGCAYYFVEMNEILEDSYESIAAIGQLKVQHIAQWRRDRLADVAVLSDNPLLREGLRSDNPRAGASDRVRSTLELYLSVRAPQYSGAMLLSPDGRVVVAAGAAPAQVGSHTKGAIQEALAQRRTVLSDLFREDNGSVAIDAIAVVTGENGAPVGAAVLRSAAREHLFPIIQDWPTPSRTAETLVVQRDADDVVYLNDLRHSSAGAALRLRRPVALTELTAVKAVLGFRGRVTGRDYRGDAVLADVQPIPQSPWFLVAKIDMREIRDLAWSRAEMIAFVVVAIGLLAGLVTAYHYRTQREAALRESVDRFDLATRATFNVIWDYDLVTGAIWRNDNFRMLFGYPVDARPDIDEWSARLHPEDRARVRAAVDAALAGDATSWSDAFRYRRKDGSYALVEDRCEILRDAAGRAVRMIGAMHDVTQRENAEQLLRLQVAALNAAANGILITDRAGTIVWANSGFTAMTGYTADEAVGRNPRELLKSGAHDREFYCDLWQTVLGGDVWHGEMTNRRKDRTLYPERQMITPLKSPDGTITHFISIKQDLTVEKRLEQQFLQSQKMEVVGRLAGGIAHDFNNLLTVINMSADLLVSNLEPGDPRRHDAAQIMEAGARAAALTRQLLAFSRKQVLKAQPLDLGDLARGMHSMLQRLIGVEIQLDVTSAQDLGLVKADAGQLEQVIMNLAVNARDAMPDGGHLTISADNVLLGEDAAVQDLSPGSYVVLAVTDTGTGMDAETRSHLFEPFFSTKQPGTGTGLGLSTVYGIVKQSGGEITVDSAPGDGATFRVYLPRTAEIPALERAAS